ncbi:hypothetical protein ACE1B6_18560 [Aerosakkonemataceae cyanobacterium BLCC-F154]|uniref:Uncharacterized protein n=1 Tax=Floridaenema fluviatile BLCC-F154 TaxID=3153640 RepID=A0ABV4YEK2_9CYAN
MFHFKTYLLIEEAIALFVERRSHCLYGCDRTLPFFTNRASALFIWMRSHLLFFIDRRSNMSISGEG